MKLFTSTQIYDQFSDKKCDLPYLKLENFKASELNIEML